MKSYTKEINASIRYIKHHFNVDGWPLSYNLHLPIMFGNILLDEKLDIEIEFIGKLLDNGLYVITTIDGIKIVKIKDEHYV